jgi:hypothetical protein
MSGRTIKTIVIPALGVVGILLSIVGFYADKARSFPTIERILAPDCAAEQGAIAFLIAHRSIDATDPNFAALATLVETKIAAANATVPRARINLEGVKVVGSALVFSTAAPTPTPSAQIELRFIGANPVQDTLNTYQKAADDLCESSNLGWSTRAFWIGAALMLVSILTALFSDWHADQRQRHPPE